MSWFIIISIVILIHWFADFVMQTHWQASNKSSNNKALLAHTITYSLCWILPIWWLFNFKFSIIFCIVTFICHTIIDYFSSRIVKNFWVKKDYHNFFIVIGADQVLHYLQIFGTIWILLDIFLE